MRGRRDCWFVLLTTALASGGASAWISSGATLGNRGRALGRKRNCRAGQDNVLVAPLVGRSEDRSRTTLRSGACLKLSAASVPSPPPSSPVISDPDVVIIGAGIGGLCCGALLAKNGLKVVICESHYLAGGCAHSFERDGFMFDSGPSIFSGMSRPPYNPLQQILQVLEEEIPLITYDGWGTLVPPHTGEHAGSGSDPKRIGEDYFKFRTGPTDFRDTVLRPLGGDVAADEFDALLALCQPLVEASAAIPPFALRADKWMALTMLPYLPQLLQVAPLADELNGPFSAVMDKVPITSKILRDWLDFLAFALSGLKADATVCAAMAYTMGDLHREGAVLEYPEGGGGAIIDALVRAFTKFGGELRLRTHIENIEVEEGKAVGVRLRGKAGGGGGEAGGGGNVLRAKKGVVSNASVWDTMKLIPEFEVSKGGKEGEEEVEEEVAKQHQRPPSSPPPAAGGDTAVAPVIPSDFREEANAVPATMSFMHLHLGLEGLDLPEGTEPHHTVINDWDDTLGELNMMAVSIPTLLDPSLAPEGCHVVHAYAAANEEWGPWEGLDRRSDEYKKLKEERAEALWKAVERIIPDARSRVRTKLEGSPLTHARFLRRSFGSYGPGYRAGEKLFPQPNYVPLPGLLCCGDSVFPGIGVPAVAVSGACAANTLLPAWKQLAMFR